MQILQSTSSHYKKYWKKMFLESIFSIFFYWSDPKKNVSLDREQRRQANASAEEEGEGGEDATLYVR